MQSRDPLYDDNGKSTIQIFPPRHRPSYHKKQDGILLVNTDGSCRYLTWYERLGYTLKQWFSKKTEEKVT